MPSLACMIIWTKQPQERDIHDKIRDVYRKMTSIGDGRH